MEPDIFDDLANSYLGVNTAPPKTSAPSNGSWWTPERVTQAVDHLQKHAKLSPIGAQGLVSRWAGVEAQGGPDSVNPTSGAFGIGQWLGPRKNGVPRDFEGQLNHAVKELNSSESAAARRLRRAQTEEDAAIGASMFERAEGYDPKTGRDNFVEPTIRHMRKFGTQSNPFDTLANSYLDANPFDDLATSYLNQPNGGGVNPTTPNVQAEAPVTAPESPATLEAQRQSAAMPQSPRVGTLYTPGEQVPPVGADETDLPLADGRVFRAPTAKLSAFLADNQTSVADIVSGKVPISSLIGKVADVQDTSQGPTVLTTAPDGTELSASITPTPEDAQRQVAVDQAAFPGSQSQVVDAQDVVDGRSLMHEQGQRLPLPINAEYQDFLKQTGLPDNQASIDEFNLAQKVSVEGANRQNAKDAAIANAEIQKQHATQQAVSNVPAAQREPTQFKAGNRLLGDEELLNTVIRYPVDFPSGFKGNKERYAVEAARKGLMRDFGLSYDQAKKAIGDIEAVGDASGINAVVSRRDLASVIGADKVRADYDAERAEPTMQGVQNAFEQEGKAPNLMPRGTGIDDRQEVDPLMAQAKANSNFAPFTLSTDANIQAEYERLKRTSPTEEETENLKGIGNLLKVFDTSVGVNTGFMKGAGWLADIGAGIYTLTPLGMAQYLFGQPIRGTEALNSLGNKARLVAAASKKDGFLFDVTDALGSAAVQIPVYVGMSALPGGAVMTFASTEGLGSLGRGENLLQVGGNTLKGAALGLVFQAAPRIGRLVSENTERAFINPVFDKGKTAAADIVLASKILGTTATLGTIGTGTFAVEKAAGASTDDAFHSAIVNTLFGLTQLGDLKGLIGKTFRMYKGKKSADVTIDPDGSVKLLKGQAPPEAVDAEINIDKVVDMKPDAQGVYRTATDTEPVRTKETVAQLGEAPPKRISKPLPDAVQKIGLDTRAQRIGDVLSDGQAKTSQEIAKATRYNLAKVNETIELLYGAGKVEVLPDNRIRLIEPLDKGSTSLYEQFDENGRIQVSQPATSMATGENVSNGQVIPPQTEAIGTPTPTTTATLTPAQQANLDWQNKVQTRIAELGEIPQVQKILENYPDISKLSTGQLKDVHKALEPLSKTGYATKTKEPWQITRAEALKHDKLSSAEPNNLTSPTPNRFKEGDIAIENGPDPYVFRMEYVDPSDTEYAELSDTDENVRKMPTTQQYAEWFKQGIEPEPITLVFNQPKGRHHSTNRRRLVAAQMAGVKRIPAWVEIGKHKDLIRTALAEGKSVPAEVLAEYPDLKGETSRPKITDSKSKSGAPQSLSQYVRRAGGMRPTDWDSGEANRLRNKETGTTGLIKKTAEKTVEQMAQSAWQMGYLRDVFPTMADVDANTFLEHVENDLTGVQKHYEQGETGTTRSEADQEALYFADQTRNQDIHDRLHSLDEKGFERVHALASLMNDDADAKIILYKAENYPDGISQEERVKFFRRAKSYGVPREHAEALLNNAARTNEARSAQSQVSEPIGTRTRTDVGYSGEEPKSEHIYGDAYEPEGEVDTSFDPAEFERDAAETVAEPTKFATTIPEAETPTPAERDLKPIPISVKRSMVRREMAKPDADPQAIADAYGLPVEQVEAARPLGEVGPYGQMSHIMRRTLMDPEHFDLLNKIAKVVLPEARVNENNPLFGADAATDALLDAIAEKSGYGRSSEMGKEGWNKFLDDYADKLPMDAVMLIHDAMAHYEEWYRKRAAFAEEIANSDLMDDIVRQSEQMGKPVITSFKDTPPLNTMKKDLRATSLRGRILAIGKKYEIEKGADGTRFTGLSRPVIESAFNEVLEKELRKRTDFSAGEAGTGTPSEKVDKTGEGEKVAQSELAPVKQTKPEAKPVKEPERSKPIELPSAPIQLPPVKEDIPSEPITDFGEKIGGARKDTAESGFTMRGGKKTEEPRWMRGFTLGELPDGKFRPFLSKDRRIIWEAKEDFDSKEDAVNAIKLAYVSSKFGVQPSTPLEPKDAKAASESADKWLQEVSTKVAELQEKNAALLFKKGLTDRFRKTLANGEITVEQFNNALDKGIILDKDDFEKAEAVEKEIADARATPLNAPAEPQRQYEIYHRVGDKKRHTVKDGFDSREDAMRYLARNLAQFLNFKPQFPSRPHIEDLQRTGKEYRTGNVTTEQFKDRFGFTGGEFGNWVPQDERQRILNMAYDGLSDLADVLGVPPKALSLGGQLSIAFGSRGTALSGAAAHYERDRAVFNLTRLNGAGSVAHEWFHALDHYFGTQNQGLTLEKDEFGLVKAPTERHKAFLSHGAGYRSQMRPEVKEAFSDLIKTIYKQPKIVKVSTDRFEKQIAYRTKEREAAIKDLRDYISREYEYARKKAPATPEQLRTFDAFIHRIKDGDHGEMVPSPTKVTSPFSAQRDVPKVFVDLNKLIQEIRGRGEFRKDSGRVRTIYQYTQSIGKAAEQLEHYRPNAEEEQTTPTKFHYDARDIDKMRVSDYWSTEHELAARAFEGYVEDKLIGRGDKSQYLVHSTYNSFYKLFGLNPYPEGIERERINAAFEKFFNIVESKTDDAGNELLYSKSSPGQVDLWGNATAMHNLQNTLFDLAPEKATKTEKPRSSVIPTATYDFLYGLRDSENKTLAKHADALISLAHDADMFGRDYAAIVEDAADALDAYALAQQLKTPTKQLLPQQDFEGKTLGERLNPRAKEFLTAYENGTIEKVLMSAMDNKPLFAIAPFYSQLERTIEQKMPKTATAEQVKGILKDAKQEEKDWLGIDQYLAENPKVSKEELLNFIRQNQADVREVVKGTEEVEHHWHKDDSSGERTYFLSGTDVEIKDHDDGTFDVLMGGEPIYEFVQSLNEAKTYGRQIAREQYQNPDNTKFSGYIKPTGSRYREVLITMPDSGSRIKDGEYPPLTATEKARLDELTKRVQQEGMDMPDADVMEMTKLRNKDKASKHDWAKPKESLSYKVSLSHAYGDTDADVNRVAHIFVEDQQIPVEQITDPALKAKLKSEGRDSAKFLNVLEVQADIMTRIRKLEKDLADGKLDEAGKKELESLKKITPYPKSYALQAVKRMIRHAVSEGYDGISWVTGDTVAERYDLSKQIAHLQYYKYKDGTYDIYAQQDEQHYQDGNSIIKEKRIPESDLEKYVGKEVAQKIIDRVGEPIHEALGDAKYGHDLSGLDLKVGGAWAKNLYDRQMVNEIGKYVKPFGAKVTSGSVPLQDLGKPSKYQINPEPDGTFAVYDQDNHLLGNYPTHAEAKADIDYFTERSLKKRAENQLPVHTLAFTPEMIGSVRTKGQPLFSAELEAIQNAAEKLKGQSPSQLANNAEYGKDKDGAFLTKNVEALAMFQAVLKMAFPKSNPFDTTGVYLRPAQVPLVAEVIADNINHLRASEPQYARSYRRLQKAFRNAIDSRGALSWVHVQPGVSKTTTRGTFQEEYMHRADDEIGVWDESSFNEHQAYRSIRRKLLRRGYNRSVILAETVGKLGRDNAAEELETTEKVVDELRFIRDLQLKRAGVSRAKYLDTYASISNANARRAENYAEQFDAESEGTRTNESEAGYDDGSLLTSDGRFGRRSGKKSPSDLAQTQHRPDERGLQLQRVPETVKVNGRPALDLPKPASRFPKLGSVQAVPRDTSQSLTTKEQRFIANRATGQEAKDLTNDVLFARSYGHVNINGKTYNLGQVAKDVAIDLANSPRAIKASSDLSAAGRQGLILAPSHPVIFTRAFAKQLAMLPPKAGARAYDRFKRDLNIHPYIELAEASELHLTSMGDGAMSHREEAFMSKILGDDPYFTGRKKEAVRKFLTFPVRASERAYVTMLDYLRINTFAALARQVHQYNVRKGQPDTQEQYTALATWINNATGRGSLGRFDDAAPILNAAFFSARYWASRLQVLNPAYYAKLPPGVRKLAIKEMLTFVAAVAGLMAILKAAGFKVETGDESNPDLVKLRVGNYSYDFTAGLIGHVRYAVRMIMAVAGEDKRDPLDSMMYLTGRYGRAKLAPIPAAIVNTTQGQNYIGEPTSKKEELFGLLTPIMLDNLKDAVKADGTAGALKMAPEFFGISTTRYAKPEEYDRKAQAENQRTDISQAEKDRRIKLWNKLAARSTKYQNR